MFTSTDGYCTICEFSPLEIGIEVDLPVVDIHNQLIVDANDDEYLEVPTEITNENNDEQLPPVEETGNANGVLPFSQFHSEGISVLISNCGPEDIKSDAAAGGDGVPKSKPKRVPFVTLSKPSDSDN